MGAGGGIGKFKVTNEPITLGHTKLERDFVPLIVERAAAIDVLGSTLPEP